MIQYIILSLLFIFPLFGETIHLTDKYANDKEEVIRSILALQQEWQINIRATQLAIDTHNGFLFVKMKPEFVLDLLDNKNATIIWASQKEELIGYIILTEIDEFFDLYKNSSIRSFACSADQTQFEEYLQSFGVKYIEQIAVKRELAHTGIGTQLINAAKQCSPYGLVAAVLTQPLANTASLSFFLKSEFTSMGYLNTIECVEWPAYQTAVLFWQAPYFQPEM